MFAGISCAGVFETTDNGKSWVPRNKGLNADFLPDPASEIGQDPHIVVAFQGDCNFMWQQNHCGIFRTTDGGNSWKDVSDKASGAYFGFAIAVDDRDAETAWVVPATADQNRTAIGGKLMVHMTKDGGKSWRAFSKGLPQRNCYDFIFRHCIDNHRDTLAMGTSGGSIYVSENRGESWESLGFHFPQVYSVRLA